MDARTRSVERTLYVGPECRLRVENRSGRVVVVGAAGQEVRVRASVELRGGEVGEGGGQALLDAVLAGITVEGNDVSVKSPLSSRPSLPFFGLPLWREPAIEYEVVAPFETQVTVEVANGNLEVRDVRRPVDVESVNGRVEVANVEATVRVGAVNGQIRVSGVAGAVNLQDVNGAVYVERIAGRLSAATQNGSIGIEEAAGATQARATNGSISYRGAVAADLDLATVHGRIELEVPRDSRFALDAESTFGGVHSDFAVKDSQGEPPETSPSVRLRTTYGSIYLRSRAGA
ncbi:MAG TPA: DUF4097 family beta strand repeat-containing protein [Dehalococcoidia bacterium]|nr:DUF4097 family beta strand repeat-containing protein [Dehalococcoidia bacterium]